MQNHPHPLVKLIARAREINKAHTTFIDTILKHQHKGRIHAEINHLEGHALSAQLEQNISFPYLLLLVSGGHTEFTIVKKFNKYQNKGKMIALVGDAELDEGNIYECLQEGWKHDLRNVWWIIDYNRQSLDGVVHEGLWEKIDSVFKSFGWNVVVIKSQSLLG